MSFRIGWRSAGWIEMAEGAWRQEFGAACEQVAPQRVGDSVTDEIRHDAEWQPRRTILRDRAGPVNVAARSQKGTQQPVSAGGAEQQQRLGAVVETGENGRMFVFIMQQFRAASRLCHFCSRPESPTHLQMLRGDCCRSEM